MLTFESPFYEIEGVIVFRDHASPTTFHYLAGPPRLTRSQGKPNLLLLKYRHALDATGTAPLLREQLGGGFLLFGVDCGIDEGVKSTIRQRLATALPDDVDPDQVSLVPVLYSRGKVHVLALDKQQPVAGEPAPGQDSKFVRGILGSATPSLLQDQRAIFSLALTPDGVTLLEEAYRSELSPIGVMYEMDFAGLRPALAVKAHVDMKRVYSQLQMRLQLGFRSGGGQAGGGPQPALGQPAAGQPAAGQPAAGQPAAGQPAAGQPAAGQPAAGQPAAGQPAAGQPAAGQPAAGGGTGVALSADLGMMLEELHQTGAIQLEIIRQQEGATVDQMETRALDLLKETLLKEFFTPAMTGQAAGASSASSATTAATAAAATAQALQASSADVNRGRSGSGGQVEIGFQLQYKKQEELKEADFDFSVIAPETRTHAPNGFFSALIKGTEQAEHIRTIDLDDPFFKVLDVDVSTTGGFEAYDLLKVVAELQYGGSIAQPAVTGSLAFAPADTAAQHFAAFLDGRDASYRYRLRYSFGQSDRVVGDRASYETPWRTATARALVVHPPDDVAMLRVRVEPGPVDWDVVERIEVHLAYDDPAHGFAAERTFFVAQTSAAQDWVLRLSDPERRTYRVAYRWYLKDHSELDGEPFDETTPQLFVRDPFDHRLDVRIVPQVDPANIRRIHVAMEYEDAGARHQVHKSVELEGPEFRPQTVTIPIMNPKRRKYSYAVTLIKTDGRAEIHEPKVTDQESITITEGGIYLDVKVVLLGDLAALGLDAVQVNLKSEPLDGERERIEEHLFQPGPERQVTKRLLLRADRPQRYLYQTTVFGPNGITESDWIEQDSAILALQARTLPGVGP